MLYKLKNTNKTKHNDDTEQNEKGSRNGLEFPWKREFCFTLRVAYILQLTHASCKCQ